jgi:hypothetical protein
VASVLIRGRKKVLNNLLHSGERKPNEKKATSIKSQKKKNKQTNAVPRKMILFAMIAVALADLADDKKNLR